MVPAPQRLTGELARATGPGAALVVNGAIGFGVRAGFDPRQGNKMPRARVAHQSSEIGLNEHDQAKPVAFLIHASFFEAQPVGPPEPQAFLVAVAS